MHFLIQTQLPRIRPENFLVYFDLKCVIQVIILMGFANYARQDIIVTVGICMSAHLERIHHLRAIALALIVNRGDITRILHQCGVKIAITGSTMNSGDLPGLEIVKTAVPENTL